MQSIHALSLPRHPHDLDAQSVNFTLPADQNFGLSPKKVHEVEKLCNLLKSLSESGSGASKSSASPECPIRHIVDVGAGQEYLTRNLATAPMSFNVLALDADDLQTEGAVKRQAKLEWWQNKTSKGKKGRQKKAQAPTEQTGSTSTPTGSVTRATIFVDQDTLPKAIGEWVCSSHVDSISTTPVLVTGLHACGSLTPAVLRSFTALYRAQIDGKTDERAWRCAGMALVGCCYNKIREIERGTTSSLGDHEIVLFSHMINFGQDVPMSRTIQTHTLRPDLHIESLHLHLAAQVTYSWLDGPEEFARGLRKIVYRARVEKLLMDRYGGEMFKAGKQVGRFNDGAYASWDEYLRRASGRLEIPHEELLALAGKDGDDVELVKRLELLHVLRCMMGPVIESLLVIDRWLYLREELDDDVEVRMINLFDQRTGSARNIALVAVL